MSQSKNKTKLILKLLADDACISILLILKESESYSDDISRKIGVPRSTVGKKIKEMENAHLIQSYDAIAPIGRKVRMYKFIDHEFSFGKVSEFLDQMKKKR